MGFAVGRGVSPAKAEQTLAKAGGLAEGENVWFYGRCNNFRPLVDVVVITNARVLGLSKTDGFTYEAPIEQVTATAYDAAKRKVTVSTADGQVMTFKAVPKDDVPVVQHYLEFARQNRAPASLVEAIGPGEPDDSSVVSITGTTTEGSKDAKKALKREQKALRDAARDAERAAVAQRVGAEVESGVFGGRQVKIFQNGYVQVGFMLLAGRMAHERLMAIEASSDVGKKSAVGRGAGAVMTGGLNLLGSNKRGDVYLTIVTDQNTHVLHEDPPTAGNMRTSKRLEAAGNAVIRHSETFQAMPHVPEVTASALPPAGQPQAVDAPQTVQVQESAPAVSDGQATGSVSDRLRELTVLRDEGLVSPEEYQQLRTKLLESL